MIAPSLCHVVEKVDQCLLFSSQVVGPECVKGLVDFDEPEEVVEAPLAALVVEGITLEVEENISRVGSGDGGEGRGAHNPPGQPRGELRAGLQGGLLPECQNRRVGEPGHRSG